MAKREITVEKTNKLELDFEFEKNTKNMAVFSELVPGGDFRMHVVGKLYMHQTAHEALGGVAKIRVTVTPGK